MAWTPAPKAADKPAARWTPPPKGADKPAPAKWAPNAKPPGGADKPTGSPSGAGTTAPIPTTITKTTVTPGPTTQPFLTPDQQNALDTLMRDTNSTITGDIDKEGQATALNTANLATALHEHDVSYETANANLAARGMFQSSIRANELNDLDAALTIRQNALNTGLQTLITNTNSEITKAQGTQTDAGAFYRGQAVANAQGADAGTQPTTTTTTVPNPAYHAPVPTWAPNAKPPGGADKPAGGFAPNTNPKGGIDTHLIPWGAAGTAPVQDKLTPAPRGPKGAGGLPNNNSKGGGGNGIPTSGGTGLK